MAAITSLFVAMLIFNIQLTFSTSDTLSCTTVIGELSGSGDDAKSEVVCPSEAPTMVSCGFFSNGGGRDGGYIEDNICYARNGYNGDRVKAYARCCSIFGGAECFDETVNLTKPGDDTKINITCPLDTTLTGCSVNTYWNKFDGILPFDGNYCQLHSSDATLWGSARCCQPSDYDADLTCDVVTATSTSKYGQVSCPEGSVMTGCSAVEVWNQLNRYYIEENTCYAERKQSNGRGWTIGGVCCEVSTPTPTPAPTLDGCDFDIDEYLDKCYCTDNGQSGMAVKSPFDQYRNNRQSYYEPQEKYYDYNYNPVQTVNNNDDLILKILCMNSLAIMVIFGYLVYVNGCSRRKEMGYGKVCDTDYDSEVRAMKA